MQDARPIPARFLHDDDDGERPSQDPIRVLSLDVQHRAEDHPYLYIVIESQGSRDRITREFVLSPYGAALLLRSVRTALETFLGYDPTDDRQSP